MSEPMKVVVTLTNDKPTWSARYLVTYELRYTLAGRVSHLMNQPYAGCMTSLCGLWSPISWWRGTGSQEEYERAASLPVCKNCDRKAARR